MNDLMLDTRRTYGKRLLPSVRLLIAFILALLAATGATAQAGSTGGATMSLQPTPAGITGCSAVKVQIWVNDVTNLYGADLRINFDPNVVQVVDADPNTAGVQITALSSFLKPDFVVKQKACNTVDPNDFDCTAAGLIWYAATQLNPTPPANGSGPIAEFELRAASAATTALTYSYHQLSTPDGVEIPSAAVNGSANTSSPAAPDLDITRLTATTARLSWTASPGAANYHLYRDLAPYFTPTDPAYQIAPGLSYDDAGAIGDATVNHFYVVKTACVTNFASGASNRVGEFDFGLKPGG